MIFKHLIFDTTEYNGNTNAIILLDDNVENDNDRIVAQAISLDIRGDFGYFLNEKNHEMEYEWTGNLFHVDIKTKERIVEISDFTDEENNLYTVNLSDWKEAILDWRQFYLHELGFLEFNSMALCHMIGVLILTYDQMSDRYCSSEMFIEAIKKCSERYGISTSVIYRDCRKVSGVYYIETFYSWATSLLENKLIPGDILSEFVLSNIDSQYGNIRPIIRKYFNVIV